MSLYETLRTVWQLERNSEQLQKLEMDFYEKARPYVNHLETQSKNETDEVLAELFQKRWNRVNFLLNDIITLRMEKHIRDAKEGRREPSILPLEEEKFRSDLNRIISRLRDQALGIETQEVSTEIDEERNYQLVIFRKKDQEVTVGADLNTYGPFDLNDLAYLPSINVRNYLKKSQVDKIELS